MPALLVPIFYFLPSSSVTTSHKDRVQSTKTYLTTVNWQREVLGQASVMIRMEMCEEIGRAACNLAVLESIHSEASSCNQMPGWDEQEPGWSQPGFLLKTRPPYSELSFNPRLTTTDLKTYIYRKVRKLLCLLNIPL